MVGDIYRYTYRRIRVYLQIHFENKMCLHKAKNGHHVSFLWPCWVWAPKDGHPMVNS